MRKILLSAVLLLAGSYAGVSAQSRLRDADMRLLDECRTVFTQGDYGAAGTLLDEWVKQTVNRKQALTEEIEYMQVVIAAERDLSTAMPAIQIFMSKYPGSMYNNRMLALMGSSHFVLHEYQDAIECFDECDPLLLDSKDCQRMVRHNAISLFRCGRAQEGYLQLNILARLVEEPDEDEDIVFYRAYYDYVNGNVEPAQKGFENSLDTRHDDEARLYLADMALNGKGDMAQAYETANNLVATTEDPYIEAEAERILGEYWYKKGEYAKSTELMTSYLTTGQSQDIRHDTYLLGMSEFQTGNMDAAIENLSQVTGPDDAVTQNALLHIGLANLGKGDKNAARMAFERASNIPGKADVREQALYNYAMVIHETSYSPFAESVTSFERFLNEYPKSAYADKVSSYLVDVYMNTTSYDAALASIAKIQNPGASILAAKMQLLYRKAMDDMAAGEYDKVPSLLTDVIALERYDRKTANDALFWRGECYYRMGQTDRAEADYSRYLALIGSGKTYNSALANYGLGYIHYNKKDYTKSGREFKAVLESSRQVGLENEIIADAALRAGDCMFYGRQYDNAKEFYGTAINLVPSTGDYALYQTALVNGLQRNYTQKILDLSKLTANYPNSPYVASALYEQGRAYQQTDQPEQAIQAFGRIINDYPNTDLARKASAETALIYYQTDKYDLAIAAYKDVIARYPGSDEARTALVDLKSIYVEKGDINTYLQYTETVQGATPIAVSERDSLTYTAAEGLFSRGQKADAKVRFKEYLDQYPGGAFAANAWYYQGLLLEEENDYDGAYESFMHSASYESSRFCESALDHASGMAWSVGDWETAMDTYMRLYTKTTNVDRQRTSLFRIVSSAGQISENEAVLLYADKALQTQLTADQKTEVKYWKAQALLSEGKRADARLLFEELCKDTRSRFGAESDYLLSQLLFDSGDKEGAEKVIMDFIQEGTPHMYWLARSFILLSDIYKSQGKDVEARQYLLSLKSNYTEDDDIADMIAKRLEE
jgi:TolA-binding protein